jgi:hypothetical protein
MLGGKVSAPIPLLSGGILFDLTIVRTPTMQPVVILDIYVTQLTMRNRISRSSEALRFRFFMLG